MSPSTTAPGHRLQGVLKKAHMLPLHPVSGICHNGRPPLRKWKASRSSALTQGLTREISKNSWKHPGFVIYGLAFVTEITWTLMDL